MKTINKDKLSVSMRLDRMLAWTSYVIYWLLSFLAIVAFVPILIEIVYGASMVEVKEAFLRLGMLWSAMPFTALLILILIGIFIVRAVIAFDKECCEDIWSVIENEKY